MENQPVQSQGYVAPKVPLTAPSVPAEPKPKFSRKIGLAIIIFLFFLISLPLGAYFLSRNIQPPQSAQVAQTMNSLVSPSLTPVPTITSSNSGTLTVTNTATWNTYTSRLEPSLSFKYPPTWTLTPNSSTSSELITLTSKNGTKITYAAGGNYNGGACSATAVDRINQVIPLPYAKGLNLIDLTFSLKSGSEEKMGIDASSPNIGKIANCSEPHLIFSSTTSFDRQIIFETDTFIQPDKQEVLQILSALKFTQ